MTCTSTNPTPPSANVDPTLDPGATEAEELTRKMREAFDQLAPLATSIVLGWSAMRRAQDARLRELPPPEPLTSRVTLSLADGLYRSGRAMRAFVEAYRDDDYGTEGTLTTIDLVDDALRSALRRPHVADILARAFADEILGEDEEDAAATGDTQASCE